MNTKMMNCISHLKSISQPELVDVDGLPVCDCNVLLYTGLGFYLGFYVGESTVMINGVWLRKKGNVNLIRWTGATEMERWTGLQEWSTGVGVANFVHQTSAVMSDFIYKSVTLGKPRGVYIAGNFRV